MVTEAEELAGILSSLDLVKFVAPQFLTAAITRD